MCCCNLLVLNPVVGCPFDCAYCFLQAYQGDPFITVYANLDTLGEELRAMRRERPEGTLRVCTGELADSLALEEWTGLSEHLVRAFASEDRAVLELKTKSASVDSLLPLRHGGRTILSFSLNTPRAAEATERGAPSPAARIRAAARAAKAGYPLAFHFDPLVRHPGWEGDYRRLVRDLFDGVPAPAVRWISLGGVRYSPSMKEAIMERRPSERLFLEEFVPCLDGKYRYFSHHRIAMYRVLLEAIRDRAPAAPVYLCMEAPFVWQRVFGALPEDIPGLEPIFKKPGCAG